MMMLILRNAGQHFNRRQPGELEEELSQSPSPRTPGGAGHYLKIMHVMFVDLIFTLI